MARMIGRRALLRGGGGLALGLPLLELMLPSRSRAGVEASPQRFVVFFSANGTIAEQWRPLGTPADYTFVDPGGPRILDPLEPWRQQLLVIEGLAMHSRGYPPGSNGHDLGMGHMLTGIPLVEGPSGYAEFSHLPDGSAGGPSIDQAIADLIGGGSAYRSLEFGVASYLELTRQLTCRMCYRGQFDVLPPENDPRAAFERLFLDLGADPAALAQLRAQRHSVLDAVAGDLESLQVRVGSADRMKLERHLTSVREIELSLDALGDLPSACAQPSMPAELDVWANENFPAIGKLQMQLMVMALACDLTRVTSLQWSGAESTVRFEWLGHSGEHHEMSHAADDDVVVRGQLAEINRWYAGQFADLLTAMADVEEPDGTLLDSAAVLWCNEQGNGQTHSSDGIPFVLAGHARGAFEVGRWLQYEGRAHNDLYVSLLRGFGDVDAEVFGLPDVCAGPLAEV
jgi:hypothetical protein